MIRLRIEGFLDGSRVQRELWEPSRWEIQEAERVTIEIGNSTSSTSASSTSSSAFLSIDLVQLPRCLSSSKVGVGAVLWDGGIVLTALLASLPPAALFGEVVVELGAGVGAPSLAAAKRGARVISTDKEAAVLGVLQQNVERTGVLSPSCRLPPEPGRVALRVLEFGTERGDAAAEALADALVGIAGRSGPSSPAAARSSPASAAAAAAAAAAERGGVDLVLAADCVYSDGDGESPDPEALCRVAARLLMRRAKGSAGAAAADAGGERGEEERPLFFPALPSSRVWLASEERDAETHALFERAAARHFASVRRLHLPAEVFGRNAATSKKKKMSSSEGGGERGENPWGHVRVFELAGAGAGTESGRSLSAAEMRALKKPRKRGWP